MPIDGHQEVHFPATAEVNNAGVRPTAGFAFQILCVVPVSALLALKLMEAVSRISRELRHGFEYTKADRQITVLPDIAGSWGVEDLPLFMRRTT